ncbi:type IV secretory system conjugative DNA transfer family protein [Hymenobacter sp. BT186]|uniref:Type IV secretory system conjugative DNA transfer family protein n=1 Tax=Hymenobacter telluris TaxID=2816474 RepID=A0A939EWT3_9BACT|nr:type IV secretory system conjugative DNA transfer family protein [Hymenobacter telluris]MBO0358639.1 type IV secretory system conjugative DNA transfer family protein [Hymenobacter telluris]MBW3374665.1 type IV secretory system conjugative DNA transfer family protein [Hymenobacter norwichensis]
MQQITTDHLVTLLRNRPNPGGLAKALLFFIGVLLTPITLAGALWGYVRGYNRFLAKRNLLPDLVELPAPVLAGMVMFAVIGWLLLLVGIVAVRNFMGMFYGSSMDTGSMMAIIGFNIVGSSLVFVGFIFWQRKFIRHAMEESRYGSARLSQVDDIAHYLTPNGLSVGGYLSYRDQGHIMTLGKTRGGKGVELIIPALLDRSAYTGSFVVIDPKGENAAITARYQKEKGQTVLLLDPWDMQTDAPATYNPLDILKPGDDLGDDAMMIAEMIVPDNPGEHDKFWTERARSVIAGLIIHIHSNKGTLIDLWRYLRLDDKAFAELVADMRYSQNPIVKVTGNELSNAMANDKMFASIIATALQHTDFLKSPALQRSMVKSNFNVNELSEGKTTMYVIIPADKLKSHSQWLRLVVTTSMRAVMRNHNRRVTFILDEFPSLGPLREISEFGLAAAAGYNISLWMILQSLPQLKNLYRDNWENFIANTAVKHYLGVSDNFTADYVSHSIGVSTIVTRTEGENSQTHSTQRQLFTADEVRIVSTESMIIQVDQKPTVIMGRNPYYLDETLLERADTNPMYSATASKR